MYSNEQQFSVMFMMAMAITFNIYKSRLYMLACTEYTEVYSNDRDAPGTVECNQDERVFQDTARYDLRTKYQMRWWLSSYHFERVYYFGLARPSGADQSKSKSLEPIDAVL